MRTSDSNDEMQAALRFLLASDMPADHKRVLIEVVTDALRRLDASDRRQEAEQRECRPWEESEMALIATFLEGKTARSWQHADELLMSLAAQLHRELNDVRDKASAAGFGAAVDFKLARQNRVIDEDTNDR